MIKTQLCFALSLILCVRNQYLQNCLATIERVFFGVLLRLCVFFIIRIINTVLGTAPEFQLQELFGVIKIKKDY